MSNESKIKMFPRVILFLYDIARFCILLSLFRENPWLLVVNALFPLMSFFLMLNGQKYAVYTPLYISGKALSIFSGIVWFAAALKTQGLAGVFLKSPLFEPDYSAFFISGSILTDALASGLRILGNGGREN